MKKVLIDSNVLLDILNEDEAWYNWSSQKFKECVDKTGIIINPIVFAETSVAFPSLGEFQKALKKTGLVWADLSQEVCFLAGKIHKQYYFPTIKLIAPDIN